MVEQTRNWHLSQILQSICRGDTNAENLIQEFQQKYPGNSVRIRACMDFGARFRRYCKEAFAFGEQDDRTAFYNLIWPFLRIKLDVVGKRFGDTFLKLLVEQYQNGFENRHPDCLKPDIPIPDRKILRKILAQKYGKISEYHANAGTGSLIEIQTGQIWSFSKADVLDQNLSEALSEGQISQYVYFVGYGNSVNGEYPTARNLELVSSDDNFFKTKIMTLVSLTEDSARTSQEDKDRMSAKTKELLKQLSELNWMDNYGAIKLIEFFEKNIKVTDEIPLFITRIKAQCYIRVREFMKAAHILQDILKSLQPDHDDRCQYLQQEACCYLADGQYDEAVKKLNSICREFPDTQTSKVLLRKAKDALWAKENGQEAPFEDLLFFEELSLLTKSRLGVYETPDGITGGLDGKTALIQEEINNREDYNSIISSTFKYFLGLATDGMNSNAIPLEVIRCYALEALQVVKDTDLTNELRWDLMKAWTLLVMTYLDETTSHNTWPKVSLETLTIASKKYSGLYDKECPWLYDSLLELLNQNALDKFFSDLNIICSRTYRVCFILEDTLKKLKDNLEKDYKDNLEKLDNLEKGDKDTLDTLKKLKDTLKKFKDNNLEESDKDDLQLNIDDLQLNIENLEEDDKNDLKLDNIRLNIPRNIRLNIPPHIRLHSNFLQEDIALFALFDNISNITVSKFNQIKEVFSQSPKGHWTDLDQARGAVLQEILEDCSKYASHYRFGDKDRFYSKIKGSLDTLLRECVEMPTTLSIEKIYPALKKIQSLFIKDILNLQNLDPEFKLRNVIDNDMYTVEKDGILSLKLRLSFTNESAPAVESLRVFPEDPSREFSGGKISEPMEAGSREFELKIKPTAQEIQDKAFSLNFKIEYTRNGQVRDTGRVFAISVQLGEQMKEDIRNAYFSYASGAFVRDKNMFFGRDDLVKEICTYLSQYSGQCFVLYGQKRSGKTSVLYHVGKRLPENCFFTPTSALEYGHENVVAAFAKSIHDPVVEKFEDLDIPLPANLPSYEEAGTDPIRTLRRISRCISRLDMQWVVAVDEFTAIYADEEEETSVFMHAWKSFMENSLFNALVIGQDTMPQFKNKYPNDFCVTHDKRITFLSRESTYEMITRPTMWNGQSRYKGNSLEAIYNITAGSPYFLQKICSEIVKYMNERQQPFITEVDVENVIESMIYGENKLEKEVFDALVTAGDEKNALVPCDQLWRVLTVIAKRSKSSGWCPVNELEDIENAGAAIDDLVERGSLELKNNKLRIKVELFTRWLQVNMRGE